MRRGIRWAEDVIDNEGMGRKSSKGLISSPDFYLMIGVGGLGCFGRVLSAEADLFGWVENIVCCIYHPPRAVGESSSESESSSDSSSSSDNEGDDLNPETRARRPGGSGKKRRRRRGCGHGHEHGDGDDRRESGGKSGGNGGKGKGNGGNAYEKIPSAVRGKREGG